MNDATDRVGAAPRLTPGTSVPPTQAPLTAPPPAGAPATEPPGWAPAIDWNAWAAVDPWGARAAWEAMVGQAQGAPAAEAESEPAPMPPPEPETGQVPRDEAARLERLQAAHAELEREIEGWSPQLAANLAVYAQTRGFTAEELAAVEDPREVKILHLAMLGEQALARQDHAQRFGGFRPPNQVGGRGHPGPLSDHSSTDAWMQARHTQLRKKARN